MRPFLTDFITLWPYGATLKPPLCAGSELHLDSFGTHGVSKTESQSEGGESWLDILVCPGWIWDPIQLVTAGVVVHDSGGSSSGCGDAH